MSDFTFVGNYFPTLSPETEVSEADAATDGMIDIGSVLPARFYWLGKDFTINITGDTEIDLADGGTFVATMPAQSIPMSRPDGASTVLEITDNLSLSIDGVFSIFEENSASSTDETFVDVTNLDTSVTRTHYDHFNFAWGVYFGVALSTASATPTLYTWVDDLGRHWFMTTIFTLAATYRRRTYNNYDTAPEDYPDTPTFTESGLVAVGGGSVGDIRGGSGTVAGEYTLTNDADSSNPFGFSALTYSERGHGSCIISCSANTTLPP